MADKGEARITVRVQSNARQNQVVGLENDVLRVRIAAPPVDGRANQELVRFLSQALGVPRSDIAIERGLASKTKLLAIRGLSQEQLMSLLTSNAATVLLR